MSAAAQPPEHPHLTAGRHWEHPAGRQLTLRLVTAEAVSGIDDAGWLRSLSRAELVRDWRPALWDRASVAADRAA